MNQKNIFTVISAVLILQGLFFFIMKDKVAADAMPGLDAAGHQAIAQMLELVSALSILIGLITYAVRTSANVVWAYVLGTLILLAVTIKHKFMDDINVPIPAMVIQICIFLACAYLWSQQKKT